MDLLKIGPRYVNLLRLSAIEEREEAGTKTVRLVLGDTTIDLDAGQSARFLDLIRRCYPVRDLDDPSTHPQPVAGKGRIVRDAEGGLEERPGA